MKKYKSKFQENEGPKNNDFVVTFYDSGDSSVGISPTREEIFVVFRNGDWMEDFVSGLKEDIVKWCRDISEGKFEYKISPINDSALNKAISNIPEQTLPGEYDSDDIEE